MYRDETKNLIESVYDLSEEQLDIGTANRFMMFNSLDLSFPNLYFKSNLGKDVFISIEDKSISNPLDDSSSGVILQVSGLNFVFGGSDIPMMVNIKGIAYVDLTYKENENASEETLAKGTYILTNYMNLLQIPNVFESFYFTNGSILNGFIVFKILNIKNLIN